MKSRGLQRFRGIIKFNPQALQLSLRSTLEVYKQSQDVHRPATRKPARRRQCSTRFTSTRQRWDVAEPDFENSHKYPSRHSALSLQVSRDSQLSLVLVHL
jgi:hypothetical protein